jgi:hypothetical protein
MAHKLCTPLDAYRFRPDWWRTAAHLLRGGQAGTLAGPAFLAALGVSLLFWSLCLAR